MLGMFAGEIVRRGGTAATARKSLSLALCGVACLAMGGLLSFVFPVNKALWSPSFTLVVGGISFAAFSLFYWIIDVRGCRRGAFFFSVIGMNSITIYLAQRVVPFGKVAKFFFGGIAAHLPAAAGGIVLSLGYVAVCWAFLLFLHCRKVHLKV